MRAQRNRFANEIKDMGCQNSKETVVEEKEKKMMELKNRMRNNQREIIKTNKQTKRKCKAKEEKKT